MIARVLLALGIAVHVGGVAALVVALVVGAGWRSLLAAALVAVVGAVWSVVLREYLADRDARERADQGAATAPPAVVRHVPSSAA